MLKYCIIIIKVPCFTDSGLEVRNRLWLKITITNAFIGSDVVDWLYDKVSEGKVKKC